MGLGTSSRRAPPSLRRRRATCAADMRAIPARGLRAGPGLAVRAAGMRWGWLYRQEIVDPLGATIDVDKFIVGDPTMSVLEIWGAE